MFFCIENVIVLLSFLKNDCFFKIFFQRFKLHFRLVQMTLKLITFVQSHKVIECFYYNNAYEQNHMFLYHVPSTTSHPNPIFNLSTKFQFFLKNVHCRLNFNEKKKVESQIFLTILYVFADFMLIMDF